MDAYAARPIPAVFACRMLALFIVTAHSPTPKSHTALGTHKQQEDFESALEDVVI